MVPVQSSASYVHVPWFVAGPGQIDVLLILMAVFLVLIVFLFGVLMLRLHHLPEHIAQKEQKVQYQLVATLGFSRCSPTKTFSGSPGYCWRCSIFPISRDHLAA